MRSLADIIKENVEIQEQEFEAHGIIDNMDRSNKIKEHDQLVLNRRRSVLLTNKCVIDKGEAKRLAIAQLRLESAI